MNLRFPIYWLLGLITFLPVSAQTVFHGSIAQADFQTYLSTYELNFLDFENVNTGSLKQELQASLKISFYSTINTSGGVISAPHNAHISSANVNGDTSRKLVGTPSTGGSEDGRVGYVLEFDTPQSIVGLVRNWTTDASTSFYNSSGTLLGTHTNTTGLEFVGFLADYNDSSTWVSKVLFNTVASSSSRQVGYTDDIIWGIAAIAIPEPSTYVQMALGLGLICLIARRRRSA